MKDIDFVTGHKNPDSDSICSAIAYSDYLFKIGRYNAVPVRIGEVSKETEYILKRFNVETPVLLKTVKQKVVDYILQECISQKTNSIKLKWSKEDLALYLGIPRPSLSRELIKLRDEGLIDFDRHFINVTDLENLEEVLFD